MLRQGYEIFVRSLEELVQNKEFETEIRDISTCETRVVKAIVSGSAEDLPDGSSLWVRALVGHLLDERPWRVRVTQVLEERR